MLVPTVTLHHQSTETFLGSKNTLTKLWSYSIKYISGHIKYHDLYYSTSVLCQDSRFTLLERSDTHTHTQSQVKQNASSVIWQKIWWPNNSETLINRSPTTEHSEAVTSFR